MDPEIVREIRENVRPALLDLIRFAQEQNLGEVAWEDGALSLQLRRVVAAVPAAHGSGAVAAAEAHGPEELHESRMLPVTSTLVGIFRRGGLESGTRVKEGDVVAYVESMRLMNEVKAPGEGLLTEILVEDGHPVEYGQPLVVLDVG